MTSFSFRLFLWVAALILCGQQIATAAKPNILWISCEDISANLGCYGDPYANTPNLDNLATEGARFTRAFTHAPVCAVVRSGVITGVYPVSIGSQHMRSRIVTPPHIKCFTEYLRAAGYFCTNRSKTDYQFDAPLTAWDRQGGGHKDWRECPEGQPFFSVINLTVCHESQIRHSEARHAQILKSIKPEQHHSPDDAGETLPAYIPNTPSARKNWAWYHDNISEMDRQVGEILDRLKADGLLENTLVVFWSDHGQGMPRGKRWPYDSGTHVPVIVRWPGNVKPNTVRGDLVNTIDFPCTMLSVAGIDVPDYMQGRVFLGDNQQPGPKYLFYHRDRMDESYEIMRAVRDNRFRYIRNFEPEKPYSQGIDYMDLMPAMIEWRRLNAEGKLTGGQKNWFQKPKPIEELYDTTADPHEIRNLANDPKHQKTLAAMRTALEDWQLEVGDLGLVPEPVLMYGMKPGGKIQKTSEPRTQISKNRLVTITCNTPGASIAYSVKEIGSKKPEWKLYSKPVSLAFGKVLQAKACRIGYTDSKIVSLTVK